MKRYLFIVASLVLIFGCTSKQVYNIQNEHIPTTKNGEQLSVDVIERAILSGAQKKGWSSRIVKPGLIEATLSIRTHKATVEIPYTKNTYSIHYKSSVNLDYSNGEIHRNYNNWIINLSKAIQDELGTNSQKY